VIYLEFVLKSSHHIFLHFIVINQNISTIIGSGTVFFIPIIDNNNLWRNILFGRAAEQHEKEVCLHFPPGSVVKLLFVSMLNSFLAIFLPHTRAYWLASWEGMTSMLPPWEAHNQRLWSARDWTGAHIRSASPHPGGSCFPSPARPGVCCLWA